MDFDIDLPDDGSVEPAMSARLCRLLALAAGAGGVVGVPHTQSTVGHRFESHFPR